MATAIAPRSAPRRADAANATPDAPTMTLRINHPPPRWAPANPIAGTSRCSEAAGRAAVNGSEPGVQGPARRSARTSRSRTPFVHARARGAHAGTDRFMEQAQRLQTFFTGLGDTRRRNKYDRGNGRFSGVGHDQGFGGG